MKVISTTDHTAMNNAIATGHIYHVEFGVSHNPAVSSKAYLVKTIEDARGAFKMFRRGFDMALVKVWTGGDVYGSERQLFCGHIN